MVGLPVKLGGASCEALVLIPASAQGPQLTPGGTGAGLGGEALRRPRPCLHHCPAGETPLRRAGLQKQKVGGSALSRGTSLATGPSAERGPGACLLHLRNHSTQAPFPMLEKTTRERAVWFTEPQFLQMRISLKVLPATAITTALMAALAFPQVS